MGSSCRSALKTTEGSREKIRELGNKGLPLPIIGRTRGHHGCASTVDKVLGEEEKCWWVTKREEKEERGRGEEQERKPCLDST